MTNISLMSEEKTRTAKEAQDYDDCPPKCATCVYFKRAPLMVFTNKVKITRRGKTRTVKVAMRADPHTNPTVDRCTFGNFLVLPTGVCNEWHSRDGERIVDEPPNA